MNLELINPYNIIKELTKENRALVEENEKLSAEIDALKKEVDDGELLD